MDADHEHVFVVRAVEDADKTLPRRGDGDAPEEVVGQLGDAGLLERRDLAVLRIEALHDVADRAVLARRIHALEHQQQRPAVLGVEPVAEIVEHGDVFAQFRLGVLFALEPPRIVGVEIPEPDFLARRDGKAVVSWQWSLSSRPKGVFEGCSHCNGTLWRPPRQVAPLPWRR